MFTTNRKKTIRECNRPTLIYNFKCDIQFMHSYLFRMNVRNVLALPPFPQFYQFWAHYALQSPTHLVSYGTAEAMPEGTKCGGN